MMGLSFYPVTRAILTIVVIGGLPIAILYFQNRFSGYVENLGLLINRPEGTNVWLEQQEQAIFSFRNRYVILASIIVEVAILAVVLRLNLPFDRSVLIAVLIYFQPIVIVGGHAIYLVTRVVLFFRELSSSPIDVDFYLPAEIALKGLYQFSSGISFVGMMLYLAHLVSFLFSPYWNSIPIGVWLIFIGSFPAVLFIFPYSNLRHLGRRAKHVHLKNLSEQLNIAFGSFKSDQSKDKIEVIEKLISIQEAIERSTDWYKDLDGYIKLIVTLLPLTLQITLIILKANTP
jgi:hypothetical protein